MMPANVFLHCYFFLCLSIIHPLIDQCHGIPTISYPQSSQIERIPSIINRGKEIVNRLRCSKGWKQFGGSCYYPSIIRSTPHTANQTCHHLPANNSHLMYIRHPIELSYAAHLFLTNNLTSLLVQTDPQLFQDKPYLNVISADDQASWRATEDKLYQARLEFEEDDNQNQTIHASDDDDDEKDDFQWFDRIGNLCQGLAWNVKKNDSRLFSFTTYKISNTVTCALTDADPNSTYEHTCQYVLNFCFGSLLCEHGECVSGLSNFKCLCDWFFEGDRCEKVSRQIIEAVVAVALCAVVIVGYSIKEICHKAKHIVNRIKQCCCTSEETTTTDESQGNNDATIMHDKSLWEKLKGPKKAVRILFAPVVSLILLCLLLVIPAVKQYYSYPLRGIDITNSQSVIDEASSLLQTCKRKSFDSLEYWIFPIISIALTANLCVLAILCKRESAENRSSSNSNTTNEQPRRSNWIPLRRIRRDAQNPEAGPLLGSSPPGQPQPRTTASTNQATPSETLRPPPGLLVPIEPHARIDRAETAAILAILTFEILKVFDDLLLAVGGSSDDGVLTKLGKKILVVLIIGFRYYPIFISLRFKNGEVQYVVLHIIRISTGAYVLGIIGYTIYRESVCFDFIPHSENFTIRDEVLLRIKLGTQFILFGLVVNTPHFLFLSYIGGEFCRRMFFGSYRKDNKRHTLQSRSNRNRADDQSWFQKLCGFIYQSDEEFTFSTISTSMYTVNIIILWHLASTFIFLYTTRTMSPISFLTNTLQKRFNIEIKDTLFHPEIVMCAIVTALIYAFQLFRGMVYLREHIKIYSCEGRSLLERDRGVNKQEAPAKATKYPGYLIRYTVGGYVITFHLLFFVFILPRLITRHSYALRQYIPSFLIFILILYVLQLLIVKIISKLIKTRKQEQQQVDNNGPQPAPQNAPTDQTNNTSTLVRRRFFARCRAYWYRSRDDVKYILQYFTLVANCFIGVVSSIVRLLLIFVINIVSINRIEFSSFADPFMDLDQANIAYWHFVYEEAYIAQIVEIIPPVQGAPVVATVQRPMDDEESEELDADGQPKVSSPDGDNRNTAPGIPV